VVITGSHFREESDSENIAKIFSNRKGDNEINANYLAANREFPHGFGPNPHSAPARSEMYPAALRRSR
jgi:hypothetical protein